MSTIMHKITILWHNWLADQSFLFYFFNIFFSKNNGYIYGNIIIFHAKVKWYLTLTKGQVSYCKPQWVLLVKIIELNGTYIWQSIEFK